MAGLKVKASCVTCLVILLTWIYQGNGQGCPSSASPVASMCAGSFVSNSRIFLDTSQVPTETSNCTCILRSTSDTVTVSLIAAPNFQGCQSQIEFISTSPVIFECMLSGIILNVSQKMQFEVHFKKSHDRASNNYCADIKAPGGFVSLECPAVQLPPTTTSTTTSTTAITTPSPTTISTSPTTDITTETKSFEDTTLTGEITTEDSTTSTFQPKTTTYIPSYTGFPSSVSQTAIIIICVIVGAGLIVGIIIAILAIIGKRNQPRRNADKNRFSVPRNTNFQLSSENGSANGVKSAERDEKYDDKLHRSRFSSDMKSPLSHKVYDNTAYVANETSYRGDNLVVSERL